MQYTIPFDWGALYVSKEAHTAYELTPLAEGVVEGRSAVDLSTKQFDPRFRLWMLAPEQLLHEEERKLFVNKSRLCLVDEITLHDSCIDMAFSFLGDRSTIQAELKNNPSKKSVEQKTTSVMAQELSTRIGGTAESLPTIEWYRQKVINRNNRIMSRGSRLILAGNLSVLGVGVALGSHDLLHTEFEGVLPGSIAVYALSLLYALGKTTHQMNFLEINYQVRAKLLGQKIGSSILDTYSTDRFDEQFSTSLEPEEI